MTVLCFFCRQPLFVQGEPPDLDGTPARPLPPELNRIYIAETACPHCGAVYELRQLARFGPTKPYKAQRPEGWEPAQT